MLSVIQLLIIKYMLRLKFRDLFPAHIIFMILCVMFFSVILNVDGLILNEREQGLMQGLIYVLAGILSVHFLFKFLWHFYLSRKVLPSEVSHHSDKDEITFNDFLEQTAPRGYKRIVSEDLGFSFCYPEGWQIIRSKEKLLHVQIKENNLKPGLTLLRNFNVSYQNIDGVPNTDFLFKAIITGLMKAIGAKLEFKEPFKTEKTYGVRYKLKYKSPKREDLCCYQIVLTNNAKKGLVLLTFTAGTRDFSKTKELFDEISNLVEIF